MIIARRLEGSLRINHNRCPATGWLRYLAAARRNCVFRRCAGAHESLRAVGDCVQATEMYGIVLNLVRVRWIHVRRDAHGTLHGQPVTGLTALAIGVAVFGLPAVVSADRDGFFERKVRPLLVQQCGDCHGAKAPKNKLNLTSVAGILKGGVSGPVVVPRNLQQSRLIQAVRYTAKLKMPPDGRLSATQIAVLEKWIRDGARVPAASTADRMRRTQGMFVVTQQDRQWWSFQPVGRSGLPTVTRSDRVRTAVDAFVLNNLESRGMTFSREADRRVLMRRVTFDLLGLPPTVEEVQAFVDDARPEAYERLVDRLLASPQYGVRWGRHWLDTVRYADTNGGGFDYVYPNAWRYRDYVVDAFNEDRPYDRFLIEQLAGDLLPMDVQPERYGERLAATGLLTLAPKGLGMQDKQQMILDVVDDQVDVLGRTLMGLTLSCARCHDHKFDPIGTTDYYALAGIFRSTEMLIDFDKNPSYWPERALELPSVTAARKTNRDRLAANAKAVADEKAKADATILAGARQRLPEYLMAAVGIRASTEHAAAVAHWTFDRHDDHVVKATSGPDGALANADDVNGPKPIPAGGRLGGALRFAGRREVVAVDPGKLAFLDFGKGADFSVSLWLRSAPDYSPTTADTVLAVTYPAAMWFIAMRPDGYNGIYLRHYDGKRAVDIRPAVDRLPLLADQGWHHVVFTSDRDGMGRVYLDGQQAGEVSIATISPAAQFNKATRFSVGAETNQFRGDLDDVAVWSRLLSASEVQTLFARAVDPARNQNVAQVEQDWIARRRSSVAQRDKFSYRQAAEQGLVPSIVRRFVEQLALASGDPEAPLYALTDKPPQTIAQVETVLTENKDVLQKLLDDTSAGPFVLGSDANQFYGSVVRQRLAKLARDTELIEQTRVEDPTLAMVAYDGKQPGDLRVHVAGDRRNLGVVAPRGFPQVLRGGSDRTIDGEQSGRLELAYWLTDSEHPLTARGFVNRLWQWHFGEGLVRTSDNFGRLGERPSHPDLLDWLAQRLMENGWSIKDLHRQLVGASTYRQTSSPPSDRALPTPDSRDSGNRLLSRMNRRRLEGEALRDAILVVSGQLDAGIGGTVNTWKPKMFSVDDANVEMANYDTRRRSIYLPIVRGAAVHEMLQLFDFGDPNSITTRRGVSTVAPQALFLMNNRWVHQQAAQFAERLEADTEHDAVGRIRHAYRLALARDPTDRELQRAVNFIDPPDAKQWELFCQMLLCLNEFAYLE